MKIGILTFSCAQNFGAALQCYALLSFLSSKGHDVSTINYCPDYLATPMPTFYSTTKDMVQRLKDYAYYLKLRYKYYLYSRFFKRYFHLTETYRDINDLHKVQNRFDYIIIGSDQVWNNHYNGHDPAWWGGFLTRTSATRIISYAASAGNAVFSTEEQEYISQSLKRFHAVSVREASLAGYLSEFCCRTATPAGITTVLDPTLILPRQQWRKWKKPNLNGRYILIYQGDHQDDNIFRFAEKTADELKCRIITTDFYANSQNKIYKFRTISPKKFVTMVMNAVCVLTNSFHGVAISIAAGTDFYAFPAINEKDMRIASLLKMAGLEDRMKDSSSGTFSTIDYEHVYDNMQPIIQQSQAFLNNNII